MDGRQGEGLPKDMHGMENIFPSHLKQLSEEANPSQVSHIYCTVLKGRKGRCGLPYDSFICQNFCQITLLWNRFKV